MQQHRGEGVDHLVIADRGPVGAGGQHRVPHHGEHGAHGRGPIYRAAQRVIMPIVLRHFYERATGWLYDWDPQNR